MDDLALLRATHHVDPPDTHLMQRERAALDTHIAAHDQRRRAGLDRPRRRHRARGPILAGTLAVGVLAGVGVAAANGLFDDNTKQMVDSTNCNISTDDAHLAASATDTRGDIIELWTIDTADGFANLIVEKNPDGTWNGASMGCDAQPRDASYPAGQPWAVAPNLTDNEATLVRLYGWVPQPATTATVTLSDGTVATANVGTGGYFLHPVTIAPNPAIDVTRIEAFAADGTLVAEFTLP